jgi:hypothetical protein
MVQDMTEKKSKRQAGKTAMVGGTPTPRHRAPRVGPLATIADVGRELASLYRASRGGRVSTGDASRLAFVLGQLRATLEAADADARLQRLERQLEALEQKEPHP